MAVWGWSYGGFVAAMALAREQDVFHCGISVAPVTTWKLYGKLIFSNIFFFKFNDTLYLKHLCNFYYLSITFLVFSPVLNLSHLFPLLLNMI